jgi:hypothetical protein
VRSNPAASLATLGITTRSPGHDPWAEVFHHNIRSFDQPAEDLFALLGFQIQGQGFLVRILGQETGSEQFLVVLGHIAKLAGQISAVGILDLDHVCAQQSQVQRGERS